MEQRIPQFPDIKSAATLEKYIRTLPKRTHIFDLFHPLSEEYYLTRNPKIYFAPEQDKRRALESHFRRVTPKAGEYPLGSWIYHPWDNTLYHLLKRPDYYRLRTVRHRDILPQKDQDTLHHKTIAVAGLSVGLNILLAFVRYGIGSTYRIADPDSVAASNLNRSMYLLTDYGINKCDVAVSHASAIDPFLKFSVFKNGLTRQTLTPFIRSADLVVDAFDRFDLKLALRKEAKRLRIPILSGFDVEKGVLLIVERYDTDSDLTLDVFLNNKSPDDLQNPSLSPGTRTGLFIDIIGKKLHSAEMLASVRNVGTTLTGYPQLIIATLAAASAFTNAAERILLNKRAPSGRTFIPLDPFT